MRILLLFIILNVIAGKLAFAAEMDTLHPGNATVGSTVDFNKSEEARPVDECRDLMPQLDSDYQDLINKIRDSRLSQQTSYDNYLSSFNKMTEVLFEMTSAKEEETKKISDSRDQLKDALVKYGQDKGAESSKALQDTYLNLTVRLYSAMMDSQKGLDSLKGELAQVESTRGQFEVTKQDMDSLDQQKLILEQKLINLKIRCQR